MDVITVDGKKYDPYFILDVTRDDTDDHVRASFRSKVKRYHPDKYTDLDKKRKYEKYFKILSESYTYIKTKRESCNVLLNNYRDRKHKNKDKIANSKRKNKPREKTISEDSPDDEKYQVKQKMSTEELDQFNEHFGNDTVNSGGYGEGYIRLQKLEDYENLDVEVVNQFGKGKFCNERFNRIFEQTKQIDDEEDVSQRALVHKTTDGFHGYNTSDFGNCALVSSFGGLMISGDISKNGYWGSGYSDYQYSFRSPKNPNSRVIVKDTDDKAGKTIKMQKPITQDDISRYKTEYNRITPNTTSARNQSQILDKTIYESLIEKEKEDEQIVKKYMGDYYTDPTIVQRALRGDLDQSPTYTSVMRQYIRN